MKQIVVATDLSERSDRAVERALSLSAALNADCAVISIVDECLPGEIAENMRASTEDRVRRVVSAQGGNRAEIDVRIGDVVPAILGIAAERDADLIVLGLHRRRDFLDVLRQTTMERIVALSRVPVLLVHEPVIGPYERVLVSVNYSRACAAAVSAVNRIAPSAEIARVHALHIPFSGLSGGQDTGMASAVRRETTEVAETWKTQMSVGGALPEMITGSVHQVLDQKLRDFQPQLLAIGAHTRSGPGLHRLGSFAAELIRQPPVDLLVARG